MKDLIIICKRELKIAFKRTEDIINVIFIPFIMVVLGSMLVFVAIQGEVAKQVDFKADGYVVNAPEQFENDLKELGIVKLDQSKIEGVKKDISKGDSDILIVFPSDFKTSSDPAEMSDIEVWYNSAQTDSAYAYQYAIGVLDTARPNVFTVNEDESVKYDLIQDQDMFVQIMDMVLPMFGLMGVLMTVAGIASYSVAADKENGFMSLLLITPVKRSSLALGKAFAMYTLCTINVISVAVGIVGVILVYPLLGLGGKAGFDFVTWGEMLACLLSATTTMTGLCFLASTLAKKARQASLPCTLIGSLLPLVSIVTIIPTVSDYIETVGIIPYLIPIFNITFCLGDVVSSSVSTVNLIVALGINLLITVAATLLAVVKFNDEKVMQV